MNRLRPLGAAFFLIMVCLYPGEALSAAAQSLAAWALSVAPALLPFLIAAPALTSPEVCLLLSRISGSFLRFMRLPLNSSGALLIGLMSGSPAGAAALSSVPPDSADPPGAYLRAAIIASGASPAFLLTGVGVALFSSPESGYLLLRSQLLASFLTALLLRSFGTDRPAAALQERKSHAAVLSAMLTLLTVGGYMVFFSVLARLLTLLLHPSLETPLLAVLELAGGCRALASLPNDVSLVLPLVSAAACFGGISVCSQCMSFLSPLGINPLEYAAGKLLHAALSAVFTFLQLELLLKDSDPLFTGALCLTMLIIILLSALRSERRSAENSPSSAI